MESRQSDARNKVIAPVFKRLGIIDQWGNGLRLVAEEMKLYPEIELRWQEVGLSFQVQFIKKGYKEVNDRDKKDSDGANVTDDVTNVSDDVTNNSLLILTLIIISTTCNSRCKQPLRPAYRSYR